MSTTHLGICGPTSGGHVLHSRYLHDYNQPRLTTTPPSRKPARMHPSPPHHSSLRWHLSLVGRAREQAALRETLDDKLAGHELLALVDPFHHVALAIAACIRRHHDARLGTIPGKDGHDG
jgi:hypothetical protein